MSPEKQEYHIPFQLLGVFSLEQSDGLGQIKGVRVVAQALFTAERPQSYRLGGSNCVMPIIFVLYFVFNFAFVHFSSVHMHFTGAEVGRPLLLDEDVQAGVQLCLHQQEGLSDGRGGDLLFSLGGCFMFPWIGLALLRSCRRAGRTLHVHALQY